MNIDELRNQVGDDVERRELLEESWEKLRQAYGKVCYAPDASATRLYVEYGRRYRGFLRTIQRMGLRH